MNKMACGNTDFLETATCAKEEMAEKLEEFAKAGLAALKKIGQCLANEAKNAFDGFVQAFDPSGDCDKEGAHFKASISVNPVGLSAKACWRAKDKSRRRLEQLGNATALRNKHIWAPIDPNWHSSAEKRRLDEQGTLTPRQRILQEIMTFAEMEEKFKVEESFSVCKKTGQCTAGAGVQVKSSLNLDPSISTSIVLTDLTDVNAGGTITLDVDIPVTVTTGVSMLVSAACSLTKSIPVPEVPKPVAAACFLTACVAVFIQGQIDLSVEGSIVAGATAVHELTARAGGKVTFDLRTGANSNTVGFDTPTSAWRIEAFGEMSARVNLKIGPVLSIMITPGVGSLWLSAFPWVAAEATMYGSFLVEKEGKTGSGTCGDDTISGDLPWNDVDGPIYNCDWYSIGSRCTQHGGSYANEGKTANMACCSCGGGKKHGEGISQDVFDSYKMTEISCQAQPARTATAASKSKYQKRKSPSVRATRGPATSSEDGFSISDESSAESNCLAMALSVRAGVEFDLGLLPRTIPSKTELISMIKPMLCDTDVYTEGLKKAMGPALGPAAGAVTKCLGIDEAVRDKLKPVCENLVDKAFGFLPDWNGLSVGSPSVCHDIAKFSTSDECADKVGCDGTMGGLTDPSGFPEVSNQK